MSDGITGRAPAPAHLQPIYEVRRRELVARLERAIAALRQQGRPVTAHAIREAGGPAYASIGRNPEAKALFERQSDRKREERDRAAVERRQRRRGADDQEVLPAGRDTLLNFPKARLAADLRRARRECDEWRTRYAALALENQQAQARLMRLERERAEDRQFLDRLRQKLAEEENQDPFA